MIAVPTNNKVLTMFKNMAADLMGTSDIGKIIEPKIMIKLILMTIFSMKTMKKFSF
jgi:hypothetical protein